MLDRLIVCGFEIDEKLIQRRPVRRCELQHCRAACCRDGVWVDYAQAQRILAHADWIQPLLPPGRRDPSRWFVELHDDDPAFPSGRYTGTAVVPDPAQPDQTTCIFLRPEDRRCAIQAASLAHDLPPWSLKPYYCCLYPLVDEYEDADGNPLTYPRLTLDDTNPLFMQGGSCSSPCATSVPLFQVYAEELALALGLEGYRELCRRLGEQPRI
ncbi:MAG: hypothetical protein ACK4WM_06650 [Thermoflexales bacterium]